MIASYLASHSTVELTWLAIGFGAQALFSARFLVQIIASERMRRSIVPDAFWYLSLGGGTLLLGYAIHQRDPVFILGQGFGLVVYLRNIYFLWSARGGAGAAEDEG